MIFFYTRKKEITFRSFQAQQTKEFTGRKIFTFFKLASAFRRVNWFIVINMKIIFNLKWRLEV
jgi:hypothetical protein